jgi:hypothetical protein
MVWYKPNFKYSSVTNGHCVGPWDGWVGGRSGERVDAEVSFRGSEGDLQMMCSS